MKALNSYKLIFVIGFLASIALGGCQYPDFDNNDNIIGCSGNVITETRQVSEFTEVENTTSATVILDQGQPLAVSIEGRDNLIPYFLTEVSGDRLTIKTKPNTNILSNKELIVHITVPKLTSLRVTGSGGAVMDGWVEDDISLETTGSGDLLIHSLVGKTLAARLSGSGDISVDGKVDDLVVKGSGSGNFDAPNLQVSSLDATLSGSGDARAWVTGTLVGSLSGSGDIEYYGSPKVTERSSGSGQVQKLGDAPE